MSEKYLKLPHALPQMFQQHHKEVRILLGKEVILQDHSILSSSKMAESIVIHRGFLTNLQLLLTLVTSLQYLVRKFVSRYFFIRFTDSLLEIFFRP